MSHDIREIQEIKFGIYSPEEVLNMSVCKIDSAKKSGLGTVYDPRMGTTDSTYLCDTCKNNATECPGHFGHIELNEPIVHPLYYKSVTAFLNCFCKKCYRLLITKDQIYLSGLNKYKGEARFSRILEKLKKVDICCQPTGNINDDGSMCICEKDQPKIKFAASDSSYYMIYEEGKKNKTSVMLSTEEIKKIFDNVPDEDVELLGFDPKLSHPRNFIITMLPVCPPCDRPYVKADGKTCDDDLTIQYIEIIKANSNLADENEQGSEKKRTRRKKEQTEQDRAKARASLRFRILTTFNNGQGKAKHTTNGRPIKGIKERLTGKEGQIRNNMMGKRCDQTARTVIGPDPTLKMGELGVPVEIAQSLTVPVRAAEFNIVQLQAMIDDGKINTIQKSDGKTVIDLKRFRRGTRLMAGDIIHREGKKITCVNGRELVLEGDQVERGGEFIKKLKPANRSYKLLPGWIVNRPLQDGDYVLLNRQPTLHKASMLAMKVLIKPHKTLRMNLAITKPFNADFD
jgi:DNA-directed RNA polymerase beta' subunit